MHGENPKLIHNHSDQRLFICTERWTQESFKLYLGP